MEEFLTLRQDNLLVMEYASHFAELWRLAPKYVAMDHMRMLRFEEGLTPYIRNQLARQLAQSSQELYERAVEIKWMKNDLRMAG